MTNAILRGKPDAGNPHVRFDEGEVASYPPIVGRPEGVAMRGAKPRRGFLLYKSENKRLSLLFTSSLLLLASAAQAEPVEYRDYDVRTGTFTNAVRECTLVTSTTRTLRSGWYAVKGEVDFALGANLTVEGDGV